MGGKLRHFLIFLLIILKEPNMPEVSGLLLIGTIILMYKRRAKYPPVGQNSSNVTGSNSDTAVSVNTSGLDHQYDDVDNCHEQAEQGQSQSNYHPLNINGLSQHEVLSALKPNPMYEGLGTRPKDPIAVRSEIAGGSDNDQTGHRPSQAVTESNTTPKAAIMTSGHYQTAIPESLNARNVSYGTEPTASVVNSQYEKHH
ncbi:Bax inhibitor 1 [Branchiostoma belcheri]|nr:Bax inhibitor 1 [Branchiostoma belcheri]